MKYYHKDTSLYSLPLLYDTSTEYENMDTEIEQLLLKACMKEGYVILQKFMDQSPYCKYLSFSLTNKTSSLFPPFPRAFVARTQIYNQTQIHQNSSVHLDIIV